MAYIRGRGVGQVSIDAPMWGYISPCGSAATGAGTPGPADSGVSSTALTLGAIGAGLVLLYALFGSGGGRG
jgi:hypothetical protein